MEFIHCRNADFPGSAAALPGKVQGFGQFCPKTLRRRKSSLKAEAFKEDLLHTH